MKKRIAVVLTAIIMSVACLTGCQSATKNYGGKTTVKLEPNQKLEEITWKDERSWCFRRNCNCHRDKGVTDDNCNSKR